MAPRLPTARVLSPSPPPTQTEGYLHHLRGGQRPSGVAVNLVEAQPRASFLGEIESCGDEPTDDYVLLQAAQGVDVAVHGRLSKDPRSLLEGCCRQEAVHLERGPCDSEEHWACGGGLPALCQDARVDLLVRLSVHQLAGQQIRVPGTIDANFT